MEFKRDFMKTQFYIIIILFSSLLTGCCMFDYSPEIKEIAEPFRGKLTAFFNKNQRFPDANEQISLLEKSGCKMKEMKCSFSGNAFSIKGGILPSKDYSLQFKLGNSRCYVGYFTDGTEKEIACYKEDCISIKQ